jgi:uncharacterized iron-regulated membrane protein
MANSREKIMHVNFTALMGVWCSAIVMILMALGFIIFG